MFCVRRVAGSSMTPTLKSGDLLLFARKKYKLNDIVLFDHEGREKVKRISGIEPGGVVLLGDNPQCSTDSREFGVLNGEVIKAVLLVHI